MTADQDDNKAKAFFTGALVAGAGFAGLAVAGIVLVFDYLLNGEPHERDQVAQRRSQDRANRYEDAVAWLDHDRAERARHRAAKREWFAADPATRGNAPSSGETFGRAAARVWNNAVVGGRRVKNGWTTGRDEARQRRDQGEPGWWRKPADATPPTPAAGEDVHVPPARGEHPGSTPARPRLADQDIVDAEIVDDPAPTIRAVVPVGQDQPVAVDGRLGEYGRRLDDLAGEVQQTVNGRVAPPAQPAIN